MGNTVGRLVGIIVGGGGGGAPEMAVKVKEELTQIGTFAAAQVPKMLRVVPAVVGKTMLNVVAFTLESLYTLIFPVQ